MNSPDGGPARPLGESVDATAEAIRLDDGYEVPAWVVSPAGTAAEGVPVGIFHGIQSHPGWFTGLAGDLARRGRTTILFTRRGSGACDAARGDAPSAAQLLADVRTCLNWACRRTGASTLAGVGISWGGKLLTAFQLRSGAAGPLGRLCLIAPGLVPRVDVGLREKLRIGLSLLTRPDRLFDIPLSDVELFTDNPLFQDYLRQDPLRLHRATARMLLASRRLDRMVARGAGESIQIPLTLILSDRDRIIHNARTYRRLQRLAAQDVRRIELAGAHTLEFEPDPSALYDAVAAAV